MVDGVLDAIAEHSHGNLRAATSMADALLDHALQHELPAIDEQTYFDVFRVPDERPEPKPKRKPTRRRTAR